MAITHRNSQAIVNQAILHMLGQMEDMLMACSTADIATWLHVTKPTAKKYLDDLAQAIYVIRLDGTYRPNRHKHLWKLSLYAKKRYRENQFCEAYHLFREARYNY
jgi:DNA-binding MarR family transcriptional regulator